MARLPGIGDLGGTPAAAARPVANYDLSGLKRGEAAVAEAAQRVGEARREVGTEIGAASRGLGTGIEKFGGGVGEVAIHESWWEHAMARAGAQADFIDAHAVLSGDPQYGPDQNGQPMQDRYADQAAAIRDKWAAQIGNAGARERFMLETAPQMAHLNVAAAARSRELGFNAMVASTQEMGNSLMDRAVRAPDDATRKELIDSHNNSVAALEATGAITPVQAVAMRQQWAHQYATADALTRAETDPQGVINELRAAPGSADAITNRIIAVEGGGRNPRSSAQGVGQFTDGTWLDMIRQNRPDLAQGRSDAEILALRADKGLARDMTEAYRASNAEYLKNRGIEPTPGAQYLAHFLGPTGAAAVLQADANKPVSDALAAVVGKDKAAAMVAANPSILAGQLSGSVKQWADAKMGGAAPGGGSFYDQLRPDQRATLLVHAEAQLQKQQVSDRADFGLRVSNAVAEAYSAGAPSKPLGLPDFIAEYGADKGPVEFAKYDTEIQTGRAIVGMATMTAPERAAVVQSLMPEPGDPAYALKSKAYDIAAKARDQLEQLAIKDPAGFAAARLPASNEAYGALAKALADPKADEATRSAAAQNYAAKTLFEQEHFGVPWSAQRITRKTYGEGLAAQWNAPTEAPGGANATLARTEAEAKLWGDAWPRVFSEIAPKLDPTMRVVASGVERVAGLALIENHGADEAKILGTQYAAKKTDVEHAVTDAIAPYAQTFVGTQGDQTRRDYMTVASKLTAIYVSRGTDAQTAAKQAVNEIIGSKYDLADTYRIPHEAHVSADQVAAGVAAARSDMGKLDVAVERDNFGGLQPDYLHQATMSALARDGKWVTAPNGEKGLMLTYKDQFWPRASDPTKPFFLSWDELAALGTRRAAEPASPLTEALP